MTTIHPISLILLFSFVLSSISFAPFSPPSNPFLPRSISSSLLQLTQSDLEYGPIGSLFRQGPIPYARRIIGPKFYLSAVEKYMLREGERREGTRKMQERDGS